LCVAFYERFAMQKGFFSFQWQQALRHTNALSVESQKAASSFTLNYRAVNGRAWLLFDYYCPRSFKSRFVQCFQWFSESSEKLGVLVKNRTTIENTAFYQAAPENSDRRHCSCQALSLCKKARRKLMHL